MPYKTKSDRKYTEATQYESSPLQVKNRTERNAARRQATKAGKVQKGDGMDVDHITPLSKGGKNRKSNERVVPEGDNRSFERNADHSLKKNVPLKGKRK